jgi:hypothetical protein
MPSLTRVGRMLHAIESFSVDSRVQSGKLARDINGRTVDV